MKRKLFKEVARNVYEPTTLSLQQKERRKWLQESRKLIKEMELEVYALENQCRHEVFFDVEGFPYTSRYCAICDTHLETI